MALSTWASEATEGPCGHARGRGIVFKGSSFFAKGCVLIIHEHSIALPRDDCTFTNKQKVKVWQLVVVAVHIAIHALMHGMFWAG